MQLEDILLPERCYCKVPWRSKRRVLTNISDLISDQFEGLEPEPIYDSLMDREQLGSTGLGNGIAIPHCRVANCAEIIGSLITLEEPAEYDAIDGKPVDILFVLIVPERESDEHITALAKLAELLSDQDLCFTLRQTVCNEDLYNIVVTY
tara:strand:- start:306 stop:755 length:450 start_codon:yes stop_codon:yes gene_type:complete